MKIHWFYVYFRCSSTSIGTTRPHLPSSDPPRAKMTPAGSENDPRWPPTGPQMTPKQSPRHKKQGSRDPGHNQPTNHPTGVAGDSAAGVLNPPPAPQGRGHGVSNLNIQVAVSCQSAKFFAYSACIYMPQLFGQVFCTSL